MMYLKKIHILILVFFIGSLNSLAQDLIRNSGFEGAWACPEGFTKLPVKELIPHWKNPNKGTPDYFHECGDSAAGIPSNFAGNIKAQEGSAYIGLILREVFKDSSKYDKASREYITIELDEELEHRQLYCFSLYYALASKSRFAVDALGISFTSEQPKSWDAGLIDMEPLVYNIPGHFMKNKDKWHELCGVFRARGNEKFLTIGNFNPNIKTHFSNLSDSSEIELIMGVPLCTLSASSITFGSGLSRQHGVSTFSCTVFTSHFTYSASLPTNIPAFTSIKSAPCSC